MKLENIKYEALPPEDQWRMPMLRDLLEARAGRLYIDLSRGDINRLIYEVTTS